MTHTQLVLIDNLLQFGIRTSADDLHKAALICTQSLVKQNAKLKLLMCVLYYCDSTVQ